MDKPFQSDGCSLVAEFDQSECCVRHDWAYWQGGPTEKRRQADDEFYACVRKTRSGWLAPFRWFGVRVFGVSFLPFPGARWGFGWIWPRAQAPPDDQSPFTVETERGALELALEKARVRDREWREKHPQ